MALEKNSGWTFWIHEGDRIRLFTVANANRSAAEDIAVSLTNYGIVTAHQEMGEGIIELLKLPFGKAMEWTPKSQ